MVTRRSPLYPVHEATGASFTEFGGWDMPVTFDSIREEHAAVRESAGIFDVSHMGEIEVAGPDATTLMRRLTTGDVTALDPGASRYTAITDEDGVLIDDTIVYRLPDGTPAGDAVAGRSAADDGGDPAYLFVPNAGHDEELTDRWVAYRDDHDLDARVENTTEAWAMVAVQGPGAAHLVADAVAGGGSGDATAVRDLPRFGTTRGAVAGVESLLARTGYTGEDGFEILCPSEDAEAVWNAFDCSPCGLGARDTLRIEMGFLLSGQDFDPETEPRTPYEAGIGFVVDLDAEFVGRDALESQKRAGIAETFTGVKLLDRGVPRGGYEVTDEDGARVGHLTSGTVSPTLSEPIGLGYLETAVARDGERVTVRIRGDDKRAVVVTPPFINK